MRTKKIIFGLLLCGGTILGMNSLQKHTEANLGWGISALAGADNNTTAIVSGSVGAAGLLAGAKIGAEIGLFGGIAGAAIGGLVGAA